MNLKGSIITDRGNNILAKGIRFFMRAYGRIINRKTGIKYKKPYGNHARIIIEQMKHDPYQVCQCEAVKDGIVIKWTDLRKQKDFKVYQLRRPMDEEEEKR